MDEHAGKLSTSALAKQLDLPAQQLFVTLKDFGWIRKADDGWLLTAKGEFEGGEYVHSQRYGRYIVWPQELAEHPLFTAMEDRRMFTAAALGKPSQLSARQVNRVLAQRGLIRPGLLGWQLTAAGRQLGGIEVDNELHGNQHLLWPEALREDEQLAQQLQYTAALFADDVGNADDLFAAEALIASDGHHCSSRAQLKICHWLYLAGLNHAMNVRLPVTEPMQATAWLPGPRLYIEYWGDHHGSGELAAQLKRKDIYHQLQLSVLELQQDDLGDLDRSLGLQLRKAGVDWY